MEKSESPVGIMERAGGPGKRRGFPPWGLLPPLLLVTCALVVVGVLYSRGKQLPSFTSWLCFSQEEKTVVKRKSRAIQQPAPMDEVCTTPGCVTTAARILQNMDPTKKPCEDFYQYACGGWLRRHVIPETHSRYSVFDILRDELEVILKGVLENSTAKDRPAVEKAKILYRSCMNESMIEKRDSQPLLNILEVVGGWPVAMDRWNETIGPKWELERQLAVMNAQFNRRVLIDLFIWNDDQNSSRHIIYIDQPTLGMPSREYYFNEGSNQKVREAYLQFMMSVATMLRKDMNLPKDSQLVQQDMAQVLELETHLANVRGGWAGAQAGPEMHLANLSVTDGFPQLNFSEDLYFENGLQNLKASAQRSLKKLREKVDQNLWIIGAAVVNAFYSPNRNQIVFPAGILQPPFFSKEQPQALNFGGIGMVIGHEITHGFDDNGRNFDKNGNMLDWWSNFSAQHFREQSECMIYQYGNFSWDLADDQNINGFSTLGENIADNGGVRQAYKAYLKWMAEGGKDQLLPGLELTYNQLFFINYAQVWCGSYRPEFAVQSIKTDVHSPLKYRVLGSLQNLAAFAEAFQCAQDTPMHPKERCRIW
ncbi:PREDICTED: membrane metallo-endopeptidase-like 1 [Dipodomys ordii]|uniref:Membrane metallo-endopeptidase-like 1 n=1 Tax=Dipodomys ordii TaxID=10020 RepID=A0A1S3GDN7_DIPOR|nr:PREDICTED: membrane metallo-endopeptidase-like 1 [Dipodomys ordii]